MTAVLKEFSAQQHAANTDPVKLMLSSSIYDAHDRRLEQLWREPANNDGPDNRTVPPTSDETRTVEQPPLRQLVDSPHYQQYDRRIADAWKNPVPVIINGGRHE